MTMRRQASIASVILLACAGQLHAFELDTGLPFTDDAVEVRPDFPAAVGWGRYQEGRVGEWRYMIDPDGYTRVGREARSDEGDWEILCDDNLDCAARRDGMRLTVDDTGAPVLTFDDLPDSTTLSLGPGGTADIEAGALAQMTPELWRQVGDAGTIRRTDTAGAAPFPADGAELVYALLRWIEGGQAPELRYAAACPPADPASPATGVTSGDRVCWPATADEPRVEEAQVEEAAASSPPVDEAAPEELSEEQASPAPAEVALVESIDTLRGVDAVYVFVDHLAEPDYLTGRLRSSVKDMAEERLRDAGLRILDEDEWKTWPGRPQLTLYFTEGARDRGCVFRTWMSFRQEVALARDPSMHVLTGTWGSGGPALDDVGESPELGTFSYHIDRFIHDHAIANGLPAREAKVAELTRPLQLALAYRGYEVGPADGIMGPQTRAAIRQAESDLGMPQTGQVSDALLQRLIDYDDGVGE